MKTIVFSLFIFSFCTFCIAQPTWIQRLSWNPGGGSMHNDSVCGIYDAVIGADGNFYLVTKDGLDGDSRLFKMDAANHQEIWSVAGGFWSSLNIVMTSFVKATPDSGCIIATNHYAYGDYEDSEIKKYSGGGILEWTHTMGGSPVNNSWTNDIVLNASGNYYVLTTDHWWSAPDSLLELDASGSLVFSTTAVHGDKLFEIAPNDLLVYIQGNSANNDSIVRTDLAGNLTWAFQDTHDDYSLAAFASTTAFFCRSDTLTGLSVIKKIDVTNGTVLWTDTLPFPYISAIDATSDDGVIVSIGIHPLVWWHFTPPPLSMNGGLIKIDSSGNISWNNTFLFPLFGLSSIKEYSPGKYITSGTWRSSNYFQYEIVGSAFVATLDSSGNGVLDSTSQMWNGDANDNHLLDIGDYLFMALASGATGSARDTLPGMVFYEHWTHKNYAVNWSQSFGNGVNFKHADLEGDGIINTSDLNAILPVQYFWYSSPLYCRSEPGNSLTSSITDFMLIPEKDSVAPGEIMRFYIIAGSSSMPVDSVIGIAFVNDYDFYLSDTSVMNVNFYNSGLGDPATNLFTTTYHYPGQMFTMFCRTDHVNAIQLYDTLGVIELKASSNITSPQLFNLQISSFYALTNSTAPVLFNTISNPIVIDPALVSIKENNVASEIEIFPNPVHNKIFVSGFRPPADLKVYDSFGHELLSDRVTTAGWEMETLNWSDGIYYLKISSAKTTENLTFIINH